MNIQIHQGLGQVGGNIIEISTETTRIILDIGRSPDREIRKHPPKVDGLFKNPSVDGLFITHYHDDHVGLVDRVHRSIPIYVGETAYRIMKISDAYKFKRLFKPAGFLVHRQSIKIGDITVTPFSCDHAAYDSYMLLCESGGEAILYTGDFRSHGRVGIDALLAELPRNPDILICEGTELYRPEHIARTELELEKQAAKLFIETKGPVFALQMPLNIERTVSLYNAARQSSRVFIEDAYMAQIAKAAGEEIVSPDKQSDVYAFLPSILRFPWYKGIKNKATKELIVSTPFVMCVRPLMHGYIRRLSRKISFEGGILLYSCRKGLKKSKSMQKFIAECEKRGLETVYLHTGGHADAKTLKRFVETVSPKALMPIHTRNPKEFERLVPGVRICNTSVNDKQKGYSEKYEL